MLEKLATHNIIEVADLLSLADKCSRAAEGRAWHTPRATQPGMPDQGTSQDHQRGKKKKGQDAGPATAAAGGGGKGPRQQQKKQKFDPRGDNRDFQGPWCPIHRTKEHDLVDCRTFRAVHDRVKQKEEQQGGRTPQPDPARGRRTDRDSSQDDEEEEPLEFQKAKRTVTVIHGRSGSITSGHARLFS